MKATACLSAVLHLTAMAHALAAKPNVLLICVDDLKPTIGCYGDTFAKTPHIDALAKRSVLFERAYCNQAVCSPSRNALIAGLRPDTLGIYDLETNFRKAAPDAVTLPQLFRKAGYRTEALGKILHVGHGNTEDAASWSVKPWKPVGSQYARPESTASSKQGKNGARGNATESAEVPDETYADGKIAAEAVARLKAAKAKPDEPFFLAVGFMKPHLPFVAPAKYWDLHDRSKVPLAGFQKAPEGAPSYAPQFGGELRQYADVPDERIFSENYQRLLVHGYYAATSYMDAQLGKVIGALDELGLAENTIIVLWGDHGWHLGDHGMWCKHTNYEQAARIPFLISTPGSKDGSGSRSDAFAESVDLYPTLCALAGLNAPGGLDGKALPLPPLGGLARKKTHAIHVYPRGSRLGRAIRTERYRLVEWKAPGASPDTAELELYDYHNDALETKNIAGQKPEVVAELSKILSTYPEAKPQVGTGAKGNPGKSKPRR